MSLLPVPLSAISSGGTILAFQVMPSLHAAVDELLRRVRPAERDAFLTKLAELPQDRMPTGRAAFLAAALRWAGIDVAVVFAAAGAGRDAHTSLLAALAGYTPEEATRPWDVESTTLVAAIRHPKFIHVAQS